MIALLLAGCTTTVRFPPDLWVWETGLFDTGAPEDTDVPVDTDLPVPTAPFGTLDAVTGDCNGAGTALTATARTVGWAGGVTLVVGTADRVESHPMLLMDADPAGAWDAYQVGPLPVGADPTTQLPSVDTAFTCDDPLSWLVWMTDRFGAPTDCVVWGADPADLTARTLEQPGLHGLSCRSPDR